MAKGPAFKLRFDEDGVLEGAEDVGGGNIPEHPQGGPPIGNLINISVVVIHHTRTNPNWCWVESGGRWFRIPC